MKENPEAPTTSARGSLSVVGDHNGPLHGMAGSRLVGFGEIRKRCWWTMENRASHRPEMPTQPRAIHRVEVEQRDKG